MTHTDYPHDLLCDIRIVGALFINPTWSCDGSYSPWGSGKRRITAEDKQRMCKFGVALFAENCDGESADFEFNREEIQALEKDESPTQGENFDFSCN